MKPLLRTWLQRVEEPVIERGKILQLQTCILPRSYGSNGGRRISLDAEECTEIMMAFDRRVRRDGGPLVTDEQAVVGRRWLEGQWRRLGMPKMVYADITHFKLTGFRIYEDNGYRMLVGPTYTAHWGKQAILEYEPMPWINGGGADHRWILPPKALAAR